MNFKTKYNQWVELVNTELDHLVRESELPQGSIFKAMRYSLMAGGKRLRPVLALAVNEMFGGDEKWVLPFGCAVEMIHTYSLIHDDLPAMDNDDYRRGMLTNHKVYGEALAILAGDALLNYAFEVMSEHILKENKRMVSGVRAMNLIARSSGVFGMIGGQVVDLESEGKVISLETLRHMHKCKTGALIKAPILAAAVINQVSEEEYQCLEIYAEKIGLAFQVKDDILDVEGDSEILGKPVGSDENNSKSTFVSIYGLKESKKMLEELIQEAITEIERFGERSGFLKELALYIMDRSN
ncbi:MAG: polyprenyl synthetase family protein [Clostridia bacterium]|nr:polyprenyl synthetase family protein [Clostridia bacterium]